MWLYVMIGGGIGAWMRYVLMGAIGRRLGESFPYATLAVNGLGSVAMGILAVWLTRQLPEHQATLRAFLAVGVLGGFTTFSTFSLDAVTLIERGQWGAAVVYIAASVIGCVGGLMIGLWALRGNGMGL